MKTDGSPFLITALIIFFISTTALSQNSSDLSKIQTGKTYKIILVDDTELTGLITYADSENVNIQMPNKTVIIIPKVNILYYSTDVRESKYTASLSLMGGVSLLSNFENYNYSSRNTQAGLNVNAGVTFYISDTKAFRFDAGYSYIKPYGGDYPVPVGSGYYSVTTGGELGLYAIKANFLIGKFTPLSKLSYYGSLGFGLHVTHTNEMQDVFPNYYDSTINYNYNITPAHTDLNAMLSLGGGMGYMISKKIGVKAEIEFDIVITTGYFIFFGGRNYFPMRAGVFYEF